MHGFVISVLPSQGINLIVTVRAPWQGKTLFPSFPPWVAKMSHRHLGAEPSPDSHFVLTCLLGEVNSQAFPGLDLRVCAGLEGLSMEFHVRLSWTVRIVEFSRREVR